VQIPGPPGGRECDRNMQQSEPQLEPRVTPSEPQRRVVGRPFLPGQPSANPEGRRVVGRQLAVEVGALTAEFERLHGRAPTHYESITLTNAARLTLRLRRPASAEDMTKLVNTVRRLLRSLGLDHAPPTRLTSQERRQARADRLLGITPPDGPAATTTVLPHAEGTSDG
jgi:hypothetical protein